MATSTPNRDDLARQVFEEVICSSSDGLGDALDLWLSIAEGASRCLAERAQEAGKAKTDDMHLPSAAAVAEAIHRAVQIARIVGRAMPSPR
jgi:hypothetical protein